MAKKLVAVAVTVGTCVLFAAPLSAHQPPDTTPRFMVENLGRSVIALRTAETSVYVGWRLLGTDPADLAFNVYRASEASAPVRLNSAPLLTTTDFVDASADLAHANTYTVRPVLRGTELAASAPFVLAANTPIQQFLTVPLQRPAGGDVEVPAGSPTSAFTTTRTTRASATWMATVSTRSS